MIMGVLSRPPTTVHCWFCLLTWEKISPSRFKFFSQVSKTTNKVLFLRCSFPIDAMFSENIECFIVPRPDTSFLLWLSTILNKKEDYFFFSRFWFCVHPIKMWPLLSLSLVLIIVNRSIKEKKKLIELSSIQICNREP